MGATEKAFYCHSKACTPGEDLPPCLYMNAHFQFLPRSRGNGSGVYPLLKADIGKRLQHQKGGEVQGQVQGA